MRRCRRGQQGIGHRSELFPPQVRQAPYHLVRTAKPERVSDGRQTLQHFERIETGQNRPFPTFDHLADRGNGFGRSDFGPVPRMRRRRSPPREVREGCQKAAGARDRPQGQAVEQLTIGEEPELVEEKLATQGSPEHEIDPRGCHPSTLERSRFADDRLSMAEKSSTSRRPLAD
jgi:hypothetical protein